MSQRPSLGLAGTVERVQVSVLQPDVHVGQSLTLECDEDGVPVLTDTEG